MRVEPLVEEIEEENAQENREFVIAQDYGSFDGDENLDSQYSSMLGDSIPGEFNLEIIGSKIEIPKMDALANIEEDLDRPNNASLQGSKIT
eukprot:CAMPEP_0197011236 /NCGR_PEP_ID=MMETSP1380-20130617/57689_1 /TAXON_ID=5936 /ORGANISM="Euplotes crassus, Strain CT5" /LENGTH=90 /DNA_ID=CAMNT_0042433769 /DNA_START=138 /DNA_END=407 /DNA_ORIENTATION=+